MPYNPYSEKSVRVPIRCKDCGHEWESRSDYPKCSDPVSTDVSCGESREWEYQRPNDVPLSQIGTETDPLRDERGALPGESDNDTPLKHSEYAEDYDHTFDMDDGEGDDDDGDEAGDDSDDADAGEADADDDPETPEESGAETDQENEEQTDQENDLENDDGGDDDGDAEEPTDEPDDPDGGSAVVTPQEYDAFHGADPDPDEGDSAAADQESLSAPTGGDLGIGISQDTLIKVGVILAVVVVGYIVYTRHLKGSKSQEGDNPEPTFEESGDGGDEPTTDDEPDDPNDRYRKRDEGEIPLFED